MWHQILQTTLFFLMAVNPFLAFTGLVLLFTHGPRKWTKRFFFGFLFQSTAFAAFVMIAIGETLAAHGAVEFGRQVIQCAPDLMLPSGLGVALLASELYLKRSRVIVQMSSILAAVTLFFFVTLQRQRDFSPYIIGTLYPSTRPDDAAAAYLPLLFGMLFLAVSAAINYKRHHLGRDLVLAIGGFQTLLSTIFGAITSATLSPFAMLMVFLLLLTQQAFMSIGVLSAVSEDADLVASPSLLIRRSLTAKAVLLFVIVLFIFVYASAAAGAILFTGISDRRSDSNQVLMLGQEAGYYNLMVEDAIAVAENALINTSVSGRVKEWDVERLTDEEKPAASGTEIKRGAGGRAVLSVVLSDERGEAVRVSRPLEFVSGVVDYRDSGGVLALDSSLIESYGEVPNLADLKVITDAGSQYGVVASGSTASSFSYHAAALKSALDDQPDAYIYTYYSQEQRDRETVSILVTALEVGFLLGLVACLPLFFGLRKLLVPLARLRRAVASVRTGDYNAAVGGAIGPDEVGQLISVFNMMSVAIRERDGQLREKIREQRDFVNYVAHELKTPSGAVKWALEMLLDDWDSMTVESKKDMVRQAGVTNIRMISLVNELLEFSRLERGAIVMKPEAADMITLVSTAIDEVRLNHADQGTNLQWQKPANISSQLRTDGKRVIQVLINIIGNAAKFSPRGAAIDISLTEETISGVQRLRVDVADHGIGIPKAEQEKLFGRFFRASNAVGASIEGTGLGLNLSKRFIEMLGGDIWFESEEGGGSRFHIALPLDHAAENDPGK
ncbi:MAG: HAMP domain-containing sensor histidine kinase [Patescibacteria group bacterium]|jgi:signal transduction histidine kinase